MSLIRSYSDPWNGVLRAHRVPPGVAKGLRAARYGDPESSSRAAARPRPDRKDPRGWLEEPAS